MVCELIMKPNRDPLQEDSSTFTVPAFWVSVQASHQDIQYRCFSDLWYTQFQRIVLYQVLYNTDTHDPKPQGRV